MIFLPFKFFFLKHRKLSALAFWLVSLKFRERFGSLRKPFLKMDSTARCNCRVMSCHPEARGSLLCSDWLITYFLEFDWLKTNYPISQVVETSVNTNNSPSQDYTTNPDDHSNHNIDSPGFKPFTVILW